MAMEPINIFSHRCDLRGVVTLLRSLAAEVEVSGPDDAWEMASVVLTPPGRKEPLRLTFRHDPDYYDGPGWPHQRLGMQGYFASFPDVERKPEVLRLIGAFRFALATDWEPDLDSDLDDRLEYLLAVARQLDGVLFTPSSLRDAEGRILIAADGTADPDAVLPEIPDAPPIAAMDLSEEDTDNEPRSPTPERVACRALALAAVTTRALLEQEDPSEPWVIDYYRDTLAWIEGLGIGEELEPDEWQILQRPPGKLEQQELIDATWRLEGLAVVAWALGRFDLPPYDELVAPQALLGSLGFPDAASARALLAKPSLRPAEELAAFRKQMFALHWRLREYSLRRQAIDFEKVAREGWFGPLDLCSLRLVGGDVALGDQAIADATEDVFQSAFSAAQERHLAINWLVEGGVYSETDTPT